ncbi:MAG: type II toxin-antitoxin system RelE/ParE family toxin [Polyangiaceae bacterium]
MTRLRVSPEAEKELGEAAAWYEERRGGLGIDLVALVDKAFEAIVAAPPSFPLWRSDRDYRKMVLKRFPYVVFFRYDANDDEVVVIAVAHSRRRPGYWVDRVP